MQCEVIDWTPTEHYPMRDGDWRIWHSNNIRCTTCGPDCGVCGVACCEYRAALIVLVDAESTELERTDAIEFIQIMDTVIPHGVDPYTFLRCTTNSGCGRWACPQCCGRCPNPICQDVQCNVRSPLCLYLPLLFILTSNRTASPTHGGPATGTLPWPKGQGTDKQQGKPANHP